MMFVFMAPALAQNVMEFSAAANGRLRPSDLGIGRPNTQTPTVLTKDYATQHCLL